MGLNDLGGGVRAGGLRNLSSIQFSAIPDSGVSRWQFEQNLNDSWGSNDGTNNGGTYNSTTVPQGDYSIEFGETDYVLFNSNSLSQFTFYWYMNATLNTNNWAIPFGEYNTTNNFIGYSGDGGYWRVRFDDGTDVDINDSFSENTTLEILVNYNGSTVELYKNGSLVGTGSATSKVFTYDCFGLPFSSSEGNYIGIIDDGRVYDDVLTPTEVD